MAAKKEAPGAEAEAPAEAPKKKGMGKLLMIIGLVVLLAGGGAGYWFFMHKGGDHKEAKTEAAKPPQFMPLDTFTVNLLQEDNPQFLQVGLTLKVTDNTAIESIKLHLPEIRDKVLLLLSSQKATTLLTVEGKRKLAQDIVDSVNGIIAPEAMKAAAKQLKAAAAKAAAKAKAKAKAGSEGGDNAAEKGTATAEADAPEEEEEEPAAAPAVTVLPVLTVLFTSFIIQ